MARARQVIPGGDELHRTRDARRGRRAPAEQCVDTVQAVPACYTGGKRSALIGRSVEGHLFATHLLREVTTCLRKLVDVLAAVAVAEKDRHRSAGILEQLVRCELAHLRGGGPPRVSGVPGLRVAVEVGGALGSGDLLRAGVA